MLSLVLFSNALSSMCSTLRGIVICCRLAHPENRAVGSLVSREDRITWLRAVQPRNAPAPIELTESGMSIDRSLLHPSNALSSIV